jgi:hypothetical protein
MIYRPPGRIRPMSVAHRMRRPGAHGRPWWVALVGPAQWCHRLSRPKLPTQRGADMLLKRSPRAGLPRQRGCRWWTEGLGVVAMVARELG